MTHGAPRLRARRRAADLYLTLALLLSLAPAVLLAVGWLGVQTGLSDWRGGLGLFMSEWASRLALAGVVSGAVGLMVALVAGFARYWRRALAILAITALTLAVYLWVSSRPTTPAPTVTAAISALI